MEDNLITIEGDDDSLLLHSKHEEQSQRSNHNHSPSCLSFYPSLCLAWPSLMGRQEECEAMASTLLRIRKYGTRSSKTSNESSTNTTDEQASLKLASKPEILHVYGTSGTGKSTAIQLSYELALSKLDASSETSGIAWVSGKYDEQVEGSRPLSAMLDAMTELYNMLEEATIQTIREKFTQEELKDLSAVIPLPPTIYSSLRQDEGGPNETDGEMVTQKNDSNQFRTFVRLFRRMLLLISNQFNAVVLALDDVQWCDEVSRDLLASILSNDDLTNFLFIAGQRTGLDEPDFNMPESNFPITKLEMKPLQDFQINDLIAGALNMDKSQTEQLSQVVHRRTGGNTLFVVQFVELLCAKKLIEQDGSGKFHWDLDVITAKTQSTSNVADILVNKLKSLPEEIQLALIIAAHIGFQFKGKIILELLENSELVFTFLSSKTDNRTSARDRYFNTFNSGLLYGGLEKARKAGLIEKLVGTDEYRFVHDRVQKCARSLLPKERTGDKMLVILGMLLLERIEAQEAEPWMIFAAVKLLTKNGSTDSICGPRLARLCLRAASAARTQSAYKQSAKHAETGCRKLGKSGWSQEYQLMLKLCCIAAEMHFAAGNMSESRTMVVRIEENVPCVEHRFRAYNVLGDILSAETNYEGCVVEYKKRLVGLGVRLPTKPGPGAVLTNLIKTKAMLMGRSTKDLLHLPAMTDKKKIQAIRMLGNVAEAYWNSGNGDGCACTCLIMLQVVLKYGLSPEGVYAFCAYGVCLGHLGDVKQCAAFFNLGRELAEKDDIALSITSCTQHNIGHFLSHELASSPIYLMKAFEASMRIGDIYKAGFNLRDVCPIGVFAGFTLTELEEKINFCVEFCKDYNQKGSYEYMLPWLQFAEVIRGQTDDYAVLSGTMLEKDTIVEIIRDQTELASNHIMVLAWHYCQNFLLLIHNMPEKILEETEIFKHIQEPTGSNYQKIINCFNCALAHFSLAATKKGCKSKAQSYGRVVKKHSVAGSPMLRTMCTLIEAEEATLLRKQRVDTAISLYEQAACEFGRQGMYLYKAITLERLARFSMTVGEKSVGLRFFQDSFNEYEAYGAAAKLSALRKQYPSIDFASPVPETNQVQ